MVTKAQLQIEIDGDASDAEAAFASAEKHVGALSKTADNATGGMSRLNAGLDGTGDAAGGASSGFSALAGAMGALGLGPFGESLQLLGDTLGGLEGVTQLWTVAQELASAAGARLAATTAFQTVKTIALGVAETVTSAATKAWTIAQTALNLVMSANPIGLLVIGIAALVGIIVLAYTKSATFRNIVAGAWAAVRAAVTAATAAMRTALNAVIGLVQTLWARAQSMASIVGAAFRTVGAAIVAPFKAIADAIQTAIGWIQRLIDKITNFHLPGWLTTGLSAIGGILGLNAAPPPPGGAAPADGPSLNPQLGRTTRAAAGGAATRTGPTTVAVHFDVILDGARITSFVERVAGRMMDDDGSALAAGSWGVVNA
jgi:hypothetical protein